MSTTLTAAHPPLAPAAATSRQRTIGRILSGFAILFLVMDGAIKLFPVSAVTDTMNQLGWAPEIAPVLGIILLASVALHLWPRTSLLGLVLITAYLGGAVATHVRIGNPLFSHILFPTYLGILLWSGLCLRDTRVRDLIF